jgi:hypothetical protein
MTRSLLLAAVSLLVAAGAAAQPVYTRFELQAPETAAFRVAVDVTIARPGAAQYTEATRKAAVSNATAIDLTTGEALKIEQKPGSMIVHLRRPVPDGAQSRIRIQATFTDRSIYYREGDTIVFRGTALPPRNSVVLPARYEIVAADVPVQVLEESDGRIIASVMQAPAVTIRARPVPQRSPSPPAAAAAPAPTPPAADAPAREQPLNQIRVTERALQDREIVYFLKEPETHAFALYHDYTAAREGEHQYVNVVRTGSTVSEPSAKILDTGEELKTRTLTGADIAREKIDIPDRVEPDTQVVLIPFPPVKKGTSLRLRISETYTDPARYALVDGQLMWHRSFGRPRNDMVLPAAWYLTASSVPAVITEESDGRIRLSYWNPRTDSLDVVVRARRR